MTSLQIYRWPDGAWAEVSMPWDELGGLILRVSFDPKRLVTLYFEEDTPNLVLWHVDVVTPPAPLWLSGAGWDLPKAFPAGAKKLRGLLLDLGAIVPKGRRDLVAWWSASSAVRDKTLKFCPMPFFVDDDRWERRLVEAEGYELPPYSSWPDKGTSQPFLGLFEGFSAMPLTSHRSAWHVGFRAGEGPVASVQYHAFSVPTLERAVEGFLRKELVLPESSRQAWIEENTEFGEFVAPTREEVELYRVTGEPLPFWWSEENFWAWADERRS